MQIYACHHDAHFCCCIDLAQCRAKNVKVSKSEFFWRSWVSTHHNSSGLILQVFATTNYHLPKKTIYDVPKMVKNATFFLPLVQKKVPTTTLKKNVQTTTLNHHFLTTRTCRSRRTETRISAQVPNQPAGPGGSTFVDAGATVKAFSKWQLLMSWWYIMRKKCWYIWSTMFFIKIYK